MRIRSDCVLAYSGFGASSGAAVLWDRQPTDMWGGAALSPGSAQPHYFADRAIIGL